MNLLPYREKQKKYRQSRKKRLVDGAVSTHSETRLLSFQPVRKRSVPFIVKRQWKHWQIKLHSRSKVARSNVDGVLLVSYRTKTVVQKAVYLRQLLFQRSWRPISVTGAFLLGVFSTGAVYHNLQASFAAESLPVSAVAGVAITAPSDTTPQAIVDEQFLTDEDIANFTELVASSQEKKVFEAKVREMVKGYPIEAMAPDILNQDRLVAAFLISIAKKESNWGKRVPVDSEGNDCFNYWGYRGIRDRMGTGGHTCFDSTHDAVTTVAKRIQTLTEREQLDTPQKMIIWKCGTSCSGQNRKDVLKWISDVEIYFSQLDQAGNAG